MAGEIIRKSLKVRDLILTRDDLDEEWVKNLVRGLKSGATTDHREGSVWVRHIPDKGDFVVD